MKTDQIPPGLVAMTSNGVVQLETVESISALRARAAALGLKQVDFTFIYGALVDKSRNEACRQLLADPQKQWLWFFDADMTFDPTVLDIILTCAFEECPWADIVGGYCNLKGYPYLPTIDRGSGMWESTDAGVGPLEVIRTGAACLLIKRHVLERMTYPWFSIRPAPKALDAIAEVDGYARQRFDGRNPFSDLPQWEQLLQCAREDALRTNGAAQHAADTFAVVGEDSSFCDKAKALGLRIIVQTNAVCGHIDKKILGPEDHMKAVREGRERQRYAVGVLE